MKGKTTYCPNCGEEVNVQSTDISSLNEVELSEIEIAEFLKEKRIELG